jgi:hypothetical protein
VSDTNVRIAESSPALRSMARDLARMDEVAGDMAANSVRVSESSGGTGCRIRAVAELGGALSRVTLVQRRRSSRV